MIENRESGIENRGSRIENGDSRIETRESGIEDRESRIENRGSRMEYGACQAGSDMMISKCWKISLKHIGTLHSVVGVTTQKASRKKSLKT